ncbi:aminotransferase class V-fold PLP-dependent enzyme [Rhodohalobacter mucosus]|uniref:Aminotransferase V n=1 Tax=Rhodohalobacter mucosus TaxID=2079485 RepID=A0A316TVU2_9BACT|nr:aminotransferase class V-fold PLP-dependent enzyme [Rhodohalobacter mucosus]PWN06634.1 aminotransferase V [Rhodohalobacter mucosus]
MLNRKEFLRQMGSVSAGLAITPMLSLKDRHETLDKLADYNGTPSEIAANEDYWYTVQQAFTADRSLINLNNGGVSPAPDVVQDAMKRHLDYSNEAPVYTMWRILQPQKEAVRQRLARTFGTDTEEIAITRNASEGLQICQLGMDLLEGDEVLTTTQDYPRMITTFKQRERREGIRLKQFPIPVPAEDPDEIVSLFEQNITPRTKLILMSHMINITGQILPVKPVVEMARRRGIPVIVDGAHTFAHFDFNRNDLGCDYYATSLHKWLFAPHGTGMLYVKKDRIRDLWPMMAAPESLDSDIRKFEEIGTHPLANFISIAEALTFHEGIGPARKGARMKYLSDYWVEQLIDDDRFVLHTSRNPEYACGIVTAQLKGIDCGELGNHLWRKYRIIVTPIKHPEFEGIRVTPNVYTTLKELDRFADAMKDVLVNGI